MPGGHDSSFDQDKAALAEMDNVSRASHHSSNNYFYNSKTGELIGRTFLSWMKLFIFYLIFCLSLSCLWGLCMGIFFQTLDFYIPKFVQRQGLIGDNPGLGYRPAGGLGFKTMDGEYKGVNMYSSLIWFRHGGDGNWDKLKQNLDKFLEEYEPGFFANQGASLTKCDFESKPITKDQSCEFNKEWLSDQGSDIKCIHEEHYGYYHGKPCILIKLNRIYGWQPDPYYDLDEVRNHTTMPSVLKQAIISTWQEECQGRGEEKELRCPQLNMVWLHCDGENDADRENIGPVTYTPFRGFPGYFFPYRNQRGYLSPVVMVQLKNPTPAILMNLECTAWARNIHHNRMKRTGLIHFELLMD